MPPKKSKYHQGIYTPKYPEKYVGDPTNIVFRSSWEKKFLVAIDLNPAVLKYASEELAIPYYSPVDSKMHRYFPDFLLQVQIPNGTIKKLMIEIKPLMQTIKPKHRKNTQKYLNEMATFTINTSKWAAAEAYCLKHGFEFMIMTEKELKI